MSDIINSVKNKKPNEFNDLIVESLDKLKESKTEDIKNDIGSSLFESERVQLDLNSILNEGKVTNPFDNMLVKGENPFMNHELMAKMNKIQRQMSSKFTVMPTNEINKFYQKYDLVANQATIKNLTTRIVRDLAKQAKDRES